MFELKLEYDRIVIESKNLMVSMCDITRNEQDVRFSTMIRDKRTCEEYQIYHNYPYTEGFIKNTQEKKDLYRIIEDIKFYLVCISYLNTCRRFNDEKLIKKAVDEVKTCFNSIVRDIQDIKDFKLRMKKIRNKA
jgi:hypothetical protein